MQPSQKSAKESAAQTRALSKTCQLFPTPLMYQVETILDTIYIKTQVFRLLRYYSPAPRNIARSDWVTQNITHNIEKQGVTIAKPTIYQDNMSLILLERNGCQSSTKWTKHMDIRYFYLTDQVQQKTIHITYCPTEELIADFFTNCKVSYFSKCVT